MGFPVWPLTQSHITHNRMRTFVASLLFLSFITLSSSLWCWDTDSQFYNMRATNTVKMKECNNDAKSCKKEWYKASIVETGDLWPQVNLPSLPGCVLGRLLLQAELRYWQRPG